MLPSRYRAFEHTLPAPYDALHGRLSAYIPADRLVTDPLRLLTWGTDASFYRLVPKIVVVVESEDDVVRLLGDCAHFGTPVTFRAAGTSLSGQAITDSVLVLLGDRWRGCELGADAQTITLQPGVIGAAANRRLAPFGRKIGPDPASIDAAMIGGIACQQCERHVLRDGAEQLPHARRLASRARRRNGARHARRLRAAPRSSSASPGSSASWMRWRAARAPTRPSRRASATSSG
jgi:hypothetical protein